MKICKLPSAVVTYIWYDVNYMVADNHASGRKVFQKNLTKQNNAVEWQDLTVFWRVSEHPIPGDDAILHHPAFLDNN